MRWCKRCCEPDTRPTCVFDDEGICQPCRYYDTLDDIDWAARRRTLDEVVGWARRHNSSGYDSIIGVSGGKDSTRQALFAKEVGLNPLLVSCAYPPEQHLERGAQNLANLVTLGFDTISVAPAPQTSKALTRHCFINYGNMFNAAELALYACLPKMAIAYRIPLILLGENPKLQWGTSAGGSEDHIGNLMRHTNTLQGGDFRRFLAPDVSEGEMFWYRYPTDVDIERAGLRIVYLGYFIPDFGDVANSRVSVLNGLRVREGREGDPMRTGSYYDSICLDDDFVLVNQLLKYLKYGFGMTSQQVSGAIRAGLMTRDEGVELVRKYDGKLADEYVERAAAYMAMSVDEFWEIAERYRSKDVWRRGKDGCWEMITPLQ